MLFELKISGPSRLSRYQCTNMDIDQIIDIHVFFHLCVFVWCFEAKIHQVLHGIPSVFAAIHWARALTAVGGRVSRPGGA